MPRGLTQALSLGAHVRGSLTTDPRSHGFRSKNSWPAWPFWKNEAPNRKRKPDMTQLPGDLGPAVLCREPAPAGSSATLEQTPSAFSSSRSWPGRELGGQPYFELRAACKDLFPLSNIWVANTGCRALA